MLACMCVCASVCVCVVTPACNHDISRREAQTVLIFGMLVYHIEYKKPIVFGGGQMSFGVNRGQIVKTL